MWRESAVGQVPKGTWDGKASRPCEGLGNSLWLEVEAAERF